MREGILAIIYFFLPAIAANMTPVFVQRYQLLTALDKPLDGGTTWRGKRVFGDHKTARGVVAGVLVGAVVGWGQHNFWLGVAMSVGTLWGDAMKSFIKRRFGLEAGRSWVPWDQVDFVIGASLTTYLMAPQPLLSYLKAVVVIGLGSLAVSYAGVRLKIKKSL